MYSTKSIVFFLVLVLVASLVDAHPIAPRHRRRSCRPKADTNTVPAVATAVAAPAVKPSSLNNAAVKPEPTPAAAPKAAATPAKASSKSDDEDAEPKSSSKSAKSDDDDVDTKPATKAASSAAAAKTSPVSLKSAKSALSALFPVGASSKSWSTAPGADNALPLSDSTLRPTRVLSALSHDYVSAPDGKKGMKAHFPKGSYTFGHQPQGGLSFYAPGPANVDLKNAKEVTFGYSVYFEAGFAWNKGGKLPGIYGGNSDDVAISCSGGRRSTACFSARLMWRGNGAGEFYTYLPPSFEANKKLCNVAPESDCNPTYGASVGRGAFHFKSGQWNTVTERVRLNDAGKSNGEIELFVEGKSVINVSGLVLRDSDAGRMRGVQMQTFFGGAFIFFLPGLACTDNLALQARTPRSLLPRTRTFGSPTSPWPSPKAFKGLTRHLRTPSSPYRHWTTPPTPH
ncbi:hypothetical protein HGRIS_013731 [Hohenbuehelia grisea]|uniref:Polysaccharide lyase 14 domain-containing protein n=1 Tax=Hohenbuehelia grisea TaxID=104357 RepID=A0ABR3IWA3_9AGAR